MSAFRRSFADARARIMAAAASWCAMACVPTQDLADYAESPSSAGAESVARSPSGAATDLPDSLSPGESDEGLDPAATPLDPGNDANPGVETGAGGTTTPPGFTPPDASAPPGCAADEVLGPDGHCYFFDASSLVWEAARSACRARGVGWDLASVLSAGESEFLGEQLPFEAWIGASDAASEGVWIWVADGREFWRGSVDGVAAEGAYINWNATEPNGGTTTNCARALPRTFGSTNPNAPWADLVCTDSLGAVCERQL
jgi:hypothetical protein